MKLKMGKLSRLSPSAVLSAFWAFLAASLRSRAALQIEILALRHQLNVLQRSVKRPRLSAVDRWLWVRLSRNWPAWRAAFKLLKPATVIGWHYKGFRLFWTWKCRHGRPQLNAGGCFYGRCPSELQIQALRSPVDYYVPRLSGIREIRQVLTP